MHHHGSGHGDDSLPGSARLLHQRRGLFDGGLHLALGRDAVAHECERQAISFLGLRDHANAAHPSDHPIAGFDVAQTPANGKLVLHYDQGVHALILDFHPLPAQAHIGFVIGGGVKIFRGAAIALHGEQLRFARIHHRTAQPEQLREDLFHRLGIVGVDLQTQVGLIAIGASHAKLLGLEAAAEFDYSVEDLRHGVGVDQVALGLHALLEWQGMGMGGHGLGLGFQITRITAIEAETPRGAATVRESPSLWSSPMVGPLNLFDQFPNLVVAVAWLQTESPRSDPEWLRFGGFLGVTRTKRQFRAVCGFLRVELVANIAIHSRFNCIAPPAGSRTAQVKVR